MVVLDGVALAGGDAPLTPGGAGGGFGLEPFGETPFGLGTLAEEPGRTVIAGCLTVPPDGLGQPNLRTEDVTYPQRDGVRHFADWYEPRIITLEDVYVCPDGCASCPSAREKVRDIMAAWSRQCDDVELVLFPDCYDPDATDADRALTGPYGVVGRPRVAEVEWLRGRSHCANLTLRFDAVDQRLFVLDADGTPGSGEQCVTLTPTVEYLCRSYDRCYEPDGMCYELQDGEGGGPVTFTVTGTECVYPTITLNGLLTDPVIENVDTGQKIGYSGTIAATDPPVTIDTRDGTATQGGASRTHLLTGSPRLLLSPGENTLRLTSFGASDDGTADVCWRPAVVWA